jgi:hypothetical protein
MATDVHDYYDLLRKAMDAQTDMNKLNSCQDDVRLEGICAESWSKHRQLPEIFVTTVHVKDQIINI